MENIQETTKKKSSVRKIRKKKEGGIYMKNALTRKVFVKFSLLGNNIIENIHNILKKKYQGKCSKEGFIKSESIRVINYSSGVVNGNNVVFDVLFECMICKPIEGMIFKCNVINITKAGIRAEIKAEESPVVVFVARDHHYKNKNFSKINQGDDITVKVIGVRFELNDDYISIIAELIKKNKSMKMKIKLK